MSSYRVEMVEVMITIQKLSYAARFIIKIFIVLFIVTACISLRGALLMAEALKLLHEENWDFSISYS